MTSHTHTLHAIWCAAFVQGGTIRVSKEALDCYPGDNNVAVFIVDANDGTGDILIKAQGAVPSLKAEVPFNPNEYQNNLSDLDDAQLAAYIAAGDFDTDGISRATREALVRLLRRSSIEKPAPWVKREMKRNANQLERDRS